MMTKTIKISLVACLTTMASFFAFYLLNLSLIIGTIASLWPAIVLFLVFIIFVVLEVVFISEFRILYPLILVQTLTPIFAFIFTFHHYKFLFSIFLFFFLFVYWGIKKGHTFLKNSLNIKFFYVAKIIIPKIVTGILLFSLALLYFNYVSLGHFDKEVAKKTFDKVLNSFEPMFKIWLPNGSFNMTVNDGIKEIALTELRRSKIRLLKQDINLNELTVSQKKIIIDDTVDNLKEKFENNFGEIKENQTIRQTLFNILNEKISALPSFAKKISGGGFLLIMFFILKSVAFVLYPFIGLITFILYKILLVTKFANISLESSRKKVINI